MSEDNKTVLIESFELKKNERPDDLESRINAKLKEKKYSVAQNNNIDQSIKTFLNDPKYITAKKKAPATELSNKLSRLYPLYRIEADNSKKVIVGSYDLKNNDVLTAKTNIDYEDYFIEADLNGADLTEANLKGADFSRANLTEAKFPLGSYFESANFTEANLTKVDLTKRTIMSNNFTRTNFTEANLTGVHLLFSSKFIGANFTRANLTKMDFSWTNITDADLTDAIISQEDLKKAKNVTEDQLKQVKEPRSF